MLTVDDLGFIADTRQELIMNRTSRITCSFVQTEIADSYSGESIKYQNSFDVEAVVDDRTSRVAAEDRVRDGAFIEEGDLWVSIGVREFSEGSSQLKVPSEGISVGQEDIEYFTWRSKTYKVVSADPKGFGDYITRYEYVGKLVT